MKVFMVIFLGIAISWILNTRTLSTFFKIKRQRLYKPDFFYETSNKKVQVNQESYQNPE